MRASVPHPASVAIERGCGVAEIGRNISASIRYLRLDGVGLCIEPLGPLLQTVEGRSGLEGYPGRAIPVDECLLPRGDTVRASLGRDLGIATADDDLGPGLAVREDAVRTLAEEKETGIRGVDSEGPLLDGIRRDSDLDLALEKFEEILVIVGIDGLCQAADS